MNLLYILFHLLNILKILSDLIIFEKKKMLILWRFDKIKFLDCIYSLVIKKIRTNISQNYSVILHCRKTFKGKIFVF